MKVMFYLSLKPHKPPAPVCSSLVIGAPNRIQKQVLLCLLCHPSVASTTSGQTGRLPSIPRRVSSLELPVWTSPSAVACCLLDTMIIPSMSGMSSRDPESPSCSDMKTVLVLYEFPLMGLLFAQDHGIIHSGSGLNHSELIGT